MNIQVEFGGKDAGLFAVADSVKRRINEMTAAGQKTRNSQEAIVRLEQQLHSVEAQRARQAWERLSTEQKIAAIKEKQAALDRAAQRAGQGTLLSRGIELKQSILASQLSQLTEGRGGGIAGSLRSWLPLISGVGGGAVGSVLGGFAAGGIGVAVGSLVSALMSSAKSAMEFADEIGDAATTLRMSSEETLRLFRAAGAAGLSTGSATGALSRLESVRASAAAGDQSSLQLLRRYGITPAMINNPDINTLSMAQTIRSSLGGEGMLTEDRNALGKLFGRRPDKMISILGQMGEANPESEKDLKLLEKGQDVEERAGFAWKDFKLRLWAVVGRMAEKTPGSIAHRILFPESPASTALGERTAAPAPSVSIDSEHMSTWEDYQNLLEADRTTRRGLPRGASLVSNADSLARIGLYNAGGAESMKGIAQRSLDSLRRIESKLDTLNQEVSAE